MSNSRRHVGIGVHCRPMSRVQSIAFAMLAFPFAAHAGGSSAIQAPEQPSALVSLDHQEGGNATRAGFVVRSGVLWFTDMKAFEHTFRSLESMVNLARNVGKDDDLPRAMIERANGFRSLRTEIVENQFRLTARGTRLDDLTVPDPTFQMLLSQDGEVAIAGALYLFDEETVHELRVDVLDSPRSSAVVAGGRHSPTSVEISDQAQLVPCWVRAVKRNGPFGTAYGASPPHRLIAYGWLWNVNTGSLIFSEFGVMSNNLTLKTIIGPLKWWVSDPATSIQATATFNVVSTGLLCSSPVAPVALTGPAGAGVSSIYRTNFVFGQNRSVDGVVMTTHNATDGAASPIVNLTLP